MSISDVKRLRLSSQSITKKNTIESWLIKLGLDFETNGRRIIVKPKDDKQKLKAIEMCFRFGFIVPQSELALIEKDLVFPQLLFSRFFNRRLGDQNEFRENKNVLEVLGWHIGCDSCKEILKIKEFNRGVVQHVHMYRNCRSLFIKMVKKFDIKNEEKFDPKNKRRYFRGREKYSNELKKHFEEKSKQYKKEGFKKLALNFKTLASTSKCLIEENEKDFNCDRYEEYLRAIKSISEKMNFKEGTFSISTYLSPFDFPRKYRNKKMMLWDKTQFNNMHEPHDPTFGQFRKQDSRGGCIPLHLDFKCHQDTRKGEKEIFVPTVLDYSDYEDPYPEKKFDVETPDDLIVEFMQPSVEFMQPYVDIEISKRCVSNICSFIKIALVIICLIVLIKVFNTV